MLTTTIWANAVIGVVETGQQILRYAKRSAFIQFSVFYKITLESVMPQFPGMNHYLQGYLFQDLHSALAGRIRALLTPLLRPRYAARLEVSVMQDSGLSDDLGIVYPDVEVVTALESTLSIPELSTAFTPATLTLPPPIKIRIPTIEVRDIKANRLVTCIEILSYANKRQPGFDQYLQKRNRLMSVGVHLIEIDLIRRGNRPIADPQIPESAYRIAVTRANDQVMVWAVQMDESLPTIPVRLCLATDVVGELYCYRTVGCRSLVVGEIA
jgi:hypothetical protein